MNDMRSILTSYERLNFDIIFAGDYNMNLLEVNNKDVITEFFDLITSFSFFPIITLLHYFANTIILLSRGSNKRYCLSVCLLTFIGYRPVLILLCFIV